MRLCSSCSTFNVALLVMQRWTSKATLGDAMLSTLQRLPRVKWVVTTLGRRGSVLVERQSPTKDAEEVVLEEKLNALLTDVADDASYGGRQGGDANDGPADCTCPSGVSIRLVSHTAAYCGWSVQPCPVVTGLCIVRLEGHCRGACLQHPSRTRRVQTSVTCLPGIALRSVSGCRAGNVISPSQAFRLQQQEKSGPPDQAHEQAADMVAAPAADQTSSSHAPSFADAAVVARLTVASAAHVPQVCLPSVVPIV